jgi:hypothetical protein
MFGFSLGNQDTAVARHNGRRDLYDVLHRQKCPLMMNKMKQQQW